MYTHACEAGRGAAPGSDVLLCCCHCCRSGASHILLIGRSDNESDTKLGWTAVLQTACYSHQVVS